ncbi:conserved hypothetical protein [Coccidioides posadasii str. Silveira]|uniref:Uncharacterized protein n=2 Tax=Coccidioides posadasii TaxID=199306 RepID=E9D3B7_COCPS|nr:conserved hypothetical protein [Coccidioides posadasii str. Silveira]KMM71459.1 hypothetical protein CPAG_07766 [Coccidioides posadasii RMSCC 3488]
MADFAAIFWRLLTAAHNNAYPTSPSKLTSSPEHNHHPGADRKDWATQLSIQPWSAECHRWEMQHAGQEQLLSSWDDEFLPSHGVRCEYSQYGEEAKFMENHPTMICLTRTQSLKLSLPSQWTQYRPDLQKGHF